MHAYLPAFHHYAGIDQPAVRDEGCVYRCASSPPFPILETPIPRFLILDRVEFMENYWLKMGRAILNFHPSIVPL